MSAFVNPPAVIYDEGAPVLWEALARYITVLEYEPVRRHGIYHTGMVPGIRTHHQWAINPAYIITKKWRLVKMPSKK